MSPNYDTCPDLNYDILSEYPQADLAYFRRFELVAAPSDSWESKKRGMG